MPLEIVVGAVIGAAAVKAVSSGKIRKSCRTGLVYGLAGILTAYDKTVAVIKNAAGDAQKIVAEAKEETKKEES